MNFADFRRIALDASHVLDDEVDNADSWAEVQRIHRAVLVGIGYMMGHTHANLPREEAEAEWASHLAAFVEAVEEGYRNAQPTVAEHRLDEIVAIAGKLRKSRRK